MGSGAMHAAGHIQDPDNTQGHTFTVGSLSHGARSDLYDGVIYTVRVPRLLQDLAMLNQCEEP